MLQRARFGLRSCDDVVQVNVSNIAHRGVKMDLRSLSRQRSQPSRHKDFVTLATEQPFIQYRLYELHISQDTYRRSHYTRAPGGTNQLVAMSVSLVLTLKPSRIDDQYR